jgi:glycerate dehydrogenase
MKLVILDAYSVNTGDLDWSPIETFGDCVIYDRTSPDELIERAKDAEVILTNKVLLTKEVIAALPNLKHIIILATGMNNVDLEAAKEASVTVDNIVGYSTHSVAQHVFALLLSITNGVDTHNQATHENKWVDCPDFTFRLQGLTELYGLSFGIIGFGNIGQAVAKIALAFGMKVLIHSGHADPKDYPDYHFISLEEIFKQSDVLSLHCPLTEKTAGIINADNLKLMKTSAILINTARGPLTDEQALTDALNNNEIAAAGVDVLSTEPPKTDNPLLKAKNCVITPHIAWATKAARERIIDQTVTHLSKY